MNALRGKIQRAVHALERIAWVEGRQKDELAVRAQGELCDALRFIAMIENGEPLPPELPTEPKA